MDSTSVECLLNHLQSVQNVATCLLAGLGWREIITVTPVLTAALAAGLLIRALQFCQPWCTTR